MCLGASLLILLWLSNTFCMALICVDSWSLFCGLHNLTCFVTERSVYSGVVRFL